jgi:hypothetical protein
MRASLGLASLLTALSLAGVASAQESAQPQVREEAKIDLLADTKPPVEEPAPAEAPPPPPYKKTLVLDSSIGAMAFLGQFRKVAPPGPWMHVQLGYELLKWLMLYGEGELAFTDTSGTQPPPRTRAFPLFGFGGGARFTVRFTDRFGVYAQGGLGAMKADIATNALGILGFRNAESLGLYLGSRLGVEWYQIDRHLALGLNAGIRLAQGFVKTGASLDTPAAVDGGVALRYAF